MPKTRASGYDESMRTSLPVRLLLVLAMMVPVLALNGLLLHILARQGLSAFHPSVPGVIKYSRVVSDEDVYDFKVRYVYEVQGVTYSSTRYAYAAWSSSNRDQMEDFVQRFPEGAHVPVFYSPGSPEDAVLVTGVQGLYLFLLMFLFPFTAAALIGSRNVLLGEDPDVFGDKYGPLAAGIMAAGHASWVMVFVMGFFMCFGLPLSVAVIAWMVVIATGVIFARKRYVERKPPPRVAPARKEFKMVKRRLPRAPVSSKERERLKRALRRSRAR